MWYIDLQKEIDILTEELNRGHAALRRLHALRYGTPKIALIDCATETVVKVYNVELEKRARLVKNKLLVFPGKGRL